MLENPIDNKSTLVRVRHQVIPVASVNPDVCPHTALFGQRELICDNTKLLRQQTACRWWQPESPKFISDIKSSLLGNMQIYNEEWRDRKSVN